METTSLLLVAYILLGSFMICMSLQHQQSVPPGLCYRVRFSVNEDVVREHALEGHVFKRSTVDSAVNCHVMCRDDCRCLSMNYIHNNAEDNCELNDVSKEIKPAALQYRSAADYYDFVSDFTYTQKDGKTLTHGKDYCFNKCCENNPCLQGGICKEICDPTSVRFNCSCPDDYTGQRCEKIKHPRSCKDLLTNGVKTSGMYNVYDSEKNHFQVYCDFDSEAGSVWMLIQSFSFGNNAIFKSKRFGVNFPVNDDEETLNWEAYRLSLPRMQSVANVSTHLRVTCNFPDEGVVYTDYARAKLDGHDLFGIWRAQCHLYEVINIRDIECKECTVGTWQIEHEMWHINSYYSKSRAGCEFNGVAGAVPGEQNFGLYNGVNVNFRCTSNASSTTQHWIGNEVK